MLSTLLLLVLSPANAEIKDYVQYQAERQRTYDHAHKYYNETRKQVIVWVDQPESDEVFKEWQLLKDRYYHVFVQTNPNIRKGIILAGDYRGQFCQLRTFVTVAGLAEAILPKPKLAVDDKCIIRNGQRL